MNKEKYIPKLVIKSGEIDTKYGWGIENNANLVRCADCSSVLHYVKIEWGIVNEEGMFQVIGNRYKRVYVLREVGFSVYCAECGNFIENYRKYFYPEDKQINELGMLDDLDEEERGEIENCLSQWNQKGDFTSRYKDAVFNNLKEKLREYEKKHPVKNKKKIENKRLKKKK